MKEKIVRAIVWRLPRSIVYWAGIRLWAHATQGPWSNTEAPAIHVDEALRRWEEQ